MSHGKLILFLGAIGIGDRIASIPYLFEQKKRGNKIYLLEYESGYFDRILNENSGILKMLKENQLYENLFIIPRNKVKLLFFIIKNFRKFDCSYAPVKTLSVQLWGFLFSKNFKYTFHSLNDTSKYNNIIFGMNKSDKFLHSYCDKLSIKYFDKYKDTFKIYNEYAVVYVGPFGRSIDFNEWRKLFNYIEHSGLLLVLVGSETLNREGWIINHINKNNWIRNLLGKTSFLELCSILSDAKFIISANGGIMWLSHLLNQRVISFSTCSGKITHPSVDNINSFHICPNDSIGCNRCELRISEQEFEKLGIKKCQFYGTSKEGICRNMITAQIFITIIDKFYNL